MTTIKINEQIAFLRKQKGLTQEELACALGVTNQAVSKWESAQCCPDIQLLPDIAKLFGVSIDVLFSDSIMDYSDIHSFMKDDDVIRVVQMRGTKVLKVTSKISPDEPPIEIAFPHDCNDRTQYFKVEVYGHLMSDSSINGDVVCHQSIQSSTINGDVKADGNIKANELNAQKITCKDTAECYKIEAKSIECAGNLSAVNLSCDQIIYKQQ